MFHGDRAATPPVRRRRKRLGRGRAARPREAQVVTAQEGTRMSRTVSMGGGHAVCVVGCADTLQEVP